MPYGSISDEQVREYHEQGDQVLQRLPLAYIEMAPKESHHPRYTPLEKVPDFAIKEAGLKRFSDSRADVSWLDVNNDMSARKLAPDA